MSTEPVGLAQDLALKGVMRSQIGHSDLAIWRSASGVVSAWENRCPHRGMRLSHGFVRGESLACAYHGWHYNCDGKCHYIPAHPTLEPPATIRPAIYSIVEQAGVIWVNTQSEASPVQLPSDMLGIRTITLECDIDRAIEAFSTVPIDDSAIVVTRVNNYCPQPKILSFETDTIDDSIVVLFQNSASDNPLLHTVTSHVLASNRYTASALVSVSRWCDSVRRHAEESAQSGAQKTLQP